MEANLDFHLTHLISRISSCEVRRDGDLVAVLSPVKSSHFNFVFGARLRDQVEVRVVQTIALFRERGSPFAWWVGPRDLPTDLGERLLEQGLVCGDGVTGMVCRKGDRRVVAFPPLDVRVVGDRQGLFQFDQIHVEAGGAPDAFELFYQTLPEEAYTGESPIRYLLGFEEGRVVTGGTLVLRDGVAGIYAVSTIPQERRRGHATALTLSMMEMAWEKGAQAIVLEATKIAVSLYEKLGFHPVCHYDSYICPNGPL